MPAQQTLAQRTEQIEKILWERIGVGHKSNHSVYVLVKELARQRAVAEEQADAAGRLADSVGRLAKVVEGILERGNK